MTFLIEVLFKIFSRSFEMGREEDDLKTKRDNRKETMSETSTRELEAKNIPNMIRFAESNLKNYPDRPVKLFFDYRENLDSAYEILSKNTRFKVTPILDQFILEVELRQ